MHIEEKTDELIEAVDWFLDYLSIERAASPHTIAAYHRDLLEMAAFLKRCGISSWSKLDSNQTSRYFAWLSKRGLSSTTISRKGASLRSLLRFLVNRGYGPSGGVPDAFSTRRKKSLPKALSVEEMLRLLEAPSAGSAIGLRDRAMLDMLYGTGLRVTELVNLRLEDYLEGESLVRVIGKRRKVRVVPLPAATHESLRKYLEKGREELVRKPTTVMFLNRNGKALSRSGVFKIIRAHARKAGIRDDISPHTLRHTYAVHLVQAGADLRSVQELLGHESVATTEVYTHLDMQTVIKKYLLAHPRAKKGK